MEVTAVPLAPIQKGSVTRFWLAMVLVGLLGLLLAWVGTRTFGQTKSGLTYQMIETGSGDNPTKEDYALVAYKGMLPDGTVFDENASAPMEISGTVPGFAEAVTLLKKGGKLRAWIPAKLAYGENPPPGSVIPANSPLNFEIKLLEFRTRAEMEEIQRQMQMQRMLQQQGGMPPGAEGAPGGAPPAP